MKSNVTNRQMFFILFLTLTAFSTISLPKLMAGVAGRSSWIPILLSSVIFGIIAYIVAKLNSMYKGKMFYDYGKEIAGKFITVLITVYYIIYYFIVGIYFKVKLTTLLASNFLPTTPAYIVLFLGILLFGYVAYKGITNIARMFEIFGVLFILTTIMLCTVMLLEGMKENILPFYNSNDAKHFLTALKKLITSYIGIGVLLVIPFSPNNKKAPKTVFLTLLFIGIIYVLLVEGTIMILGLNNTIALNDSFIEGIKLVQIPVIERTDIFYLIFGLLSLFAGMISVFVIILELCCKLLPRVKRIILMFSIDFIFFILSLFALKINNMHDVFESFAPYLLIISAFFPILLFVVAKIKKLKEKEV